MSDGHEPLNWYASAEASATVERPLAVAAHLFDSGEIIELSIKPSLWYIPIVSTRVVAVLGLAAASVAVFAAGRWTPVTGNVFALLLIGILARVVLASLQWASRVYVLTDRRIIRFSGVLNVRVNELPLAKVAHAQLALAPPSKLFGIGTIRLDGSDERLGCISWDHVSRPATVYDTVVRAIRRAQERCGR